VKGPALGNARISFTAREMPRLPHLSGNLLLGHSSLAESFRPTWGIIRRRSIADSFRRVFRRASRYRAGEAIALASRYYDAGEVA